MSEVTPGVPMKTRIANGGPLPVNQQKEIAAAISIRNSSSDSSSGIANNINNNQFSTAAATVPLIVVGPNESDNCRPSPNTNTSNRLLKRTLTFTRNALNGSRMSKRKSKHKDSNQESPPPPLCNNNSSSMVISDMENNLDSCQKHQQNRKLFRKPSWNKFFNKVMQKVSTLGVNNNKNLCSSYVLSYGNNHHHHHHHHRRRHSNRRLGQTPDDNRVLPPPTTGPVNLRSTATFPGRVPGVIGLRNHGNTCFINAVLQCLSHTDVLAEYFVLDQYKADLSRRNKLNSKKYGTKGEVTEQLAVLLKSIWSCQYDPEISNKFKSVVDKYGSQYRGNNQHDAQEFLLWLLDKVHEDLNTATKKKYKVIKNSFGRPDEIVAAETLANHVRCNDSFVHAVFQAQFRSSLTCPRCKRQSNTFDPFLCVSVPVPHDDRLCHRPIYVTVVYTSQQPRQVKLGLSLPVDADIRDLREALASDTGVSEPHMLITEIDDLGFHRTFADNQPTGVIKETEPIYCLELPQLKETSHDSGEYILLCWVNVLVLDEQCARFNSPFTMQMCRETPYADVQKLLLKEMAWTLHDDVLTSGQEVPLFRMRVCDAGGGAASRADHAYLDPSLDHPLYAEAVDQALAMCDPQAGQPHLKLVLEWDLAAKESTIADDSDIVEEHSSVKQLRSNADQGGSVTLEECFELYTRAEVLGAEDAWHCPNCNLKQEVVKKLGLWSLPDILVIHLKRFRHSTTSKTQAPPPRSPMKLTTLVDFPPYGFDMSPHLSPGAGVACSGGQADQPPPNGRLLLWPHRSRLLRMGLPPRPPPPPPPADRLQPEDYTYDLYAVCNHHGQDLQGGHYTAYCRNPYDAQWYCFDDTKVVPVSESGLVTAAAYILFYQRRGLMLSSSTSSSSSSSSSSTSSSCSTGGTGSEHWASRLVITPDPDPATPETLPTNNEADNILNNNNKGVPVERVEEPKIERNSINRGGGEVLQQQQPSTKRPVVIQIGGDEGVKEKDSRHPYPAPAPAPLKKEENEKAMLAEEEEEEDDDDDEIGICADNCSPRLLPSHKELLSESCV